jgi:hypothetical protein
VYDVVIFFLTLVRLRSTEMIQDSPVGRKLYVDGLLYVAVAAAVNTAIVVIQLLPDSFQFLKPSVVPFSIVVTVSIQALPGSCLEADTGMA